MLFCIHYIPFSLILTYGSFDYIVVCSVLPKCNVCVCSHTKSSFYIGLVISKNIVSCLC